MINSYEKIAANFNKDDYLKQNEVMTQILLIELECDLMEMVQMIMVMGVMLMIMLIELLLIVILHDP